ncbi:MAG: AAA family ATPase, partial [Myxococcales bacterium]
MLTCLRVRSFAIIEALEVELDTGLNIVTGETGAGKSILVDALQLVLGARGRPDVVRTDAEAAEVEALFELRDEPEVLSALREQGVETDGELLIRRVVSATGRTRAYINGRLATLAQLKEVTKGLADISSQHEYHSLADPRHHLTYLDAFANHSGLVGNVEQAHAALVEAAARLEEVVTEERGRVDREDLLRFQVSEIDELRDVIESEEDLSVERERLRHAEKLGSAAGEAEAQLYADDDSICGSLSRIASSVEHASGFDPILEPMAGQVREALVQLEDAASELGRYARNLSFDPARLAALEDQLDRLSRIKRKYGEARHEILAYRDQAAAELDSLERYEERLDRCQREYDEALERA